MNWRTGIVIVLFAFAGGLLRADTIPFRDDSESRVQERLAAISGRLHCLVCEDVPLAESQARLAQDLRREIRALIHEDRSDQEIVAALLNRYSDFLRPKASGAESAFGWGLAALLAIAAAGLVISRRRSWTIDSGSIGRVP